MSRYPYLHIWDKIPISTHMGKQDTHIYTYGYLMYTHRYICIHTDMCVYIHTHMCTYIYIWYIQIYVYTYIHICIHTDMYVYIHIHIHALTQMFAHHRVKSYTHVYHTFTYIYSYIYIYVYAYVNIYVYIHVYIHTCHTNTYGVALVSGIDKMTGLFCKRAL